MNDAGCPKVDTLARSGAGWAKQIIAKSPTVRGRYMLSNGDEYPCDARSLNVDSAEIVASKSGLIGEWIICYLDDIGIVPGCIRQLTHDGFLIAIHVTEVRRTRIAANLEWIESQASEKAQQRKSRRIVPKHTSVEIEVSENLTLPGVVTDISLLGAAIAMDLKDRPKLGAIVRVGKRYSTVTRWTEDGIAVQFKLPFLSETFSEHVRL